MEGAAGGRIDGGGRVAGEDDALARGQLAERALATLAELLPGSAYTALDDAINAFDFELARQLVTDLRNRYSKLNPLFNNNTHRLYKLLKSSLVQM